MKIDINPRQQGRIGMTLSLRQSLEMLRMPQTELAQFLSSELERNPLLDLDMDCPAAQSDRDISQIPAQNTLYDHLMRQIGEHFASLHEQSRAIELIEQLDERGFLPADIPNTPLLSTLQGFDPPGLFARNLQECLLLQLDRTSIAHQIVNSHFQDLLHGRFEKIKKNLRISDLTPAIQIIGRLNQRPADLFRQAAPAPLIIPDLSITKLGNTWTIETREEELPKLHLRSDYLVFSLASVEEKQSLRYWAASAKWLLKAIKKRRWLLLKIGALLVCKQSAYLDQKGPLQSLTIQELAHHLHLHQSTLSRALSGKYALTPCGLIPLSSLLSVSPEMDRAKLTLQKLIDLEDQDHPMSDQEIVSRLKTMGMTIARRTIAKYRKKLNIAPALRRKHLR